MDTEGISENPWGLEPLLEVGGLAADLGVPVSTDYDWRTRGLGPCAYRFGKHLKLAVSDVRIWVEQQRDEPFPGGIVTRYQRRLQQIIERVCAGRLCIAVEVLVSLAEAASAFRLRMHTRDAIAKGEPTDRFVVVA